LHEGQVENKKGTIHYSDANKEVHANESNRNSGGGGGGDRVNQDTQRPNK